MAGWLRLCTLACSLLPACLPACRVWELGEPALVGEAPEPPRCRELRKSYGERAHSGQVLFLACPADGQLVWSASAKGVLLWDAASGAFLGVLQRAVGRPPPQATASEIQAINSSDSAALKFKVDSSKVSLGGRHQGCDPALLCCCNWISIRQLCAVVALFSSIQT
jgi:hypothetical protein